MLDYKFQLFLLVAEMKSFSKAAAANFTTPTAVNKQISLLEKALGIKLFYRTYHGLTLTRAGQSLYGDVKYILPYFNESIVRAKKANLKDNGIIRITSSPTVPSHVLYRLCAKVCINDPAIKYQIMPFLSLGETVYDVLSTLGEELDIIFSNYDTRLLSLYNCRALELARFPFQCALSLNHPLATKKEISLSDLYGGHMLILKEGVSKSVDRIRYFLKKNHPQITLHDFGLFNSKVFTLCRNEGYVALTIRAWEKDFSLLKLVAVDWDFSVSCGLIHTSDSEPQVHRFLEIAQAFAEEAFQ